MKPAQRDQPRRFIGPLACGLAVAGLAAYPTKSALIARGRGQPVPNRPFGPLPRGIPEWHPEARSIVGATQRKAKNESVFREVNERIEDVATEFSVPDEASFVCECGDAECTQMVSMTLVEYRGVRSHGARFAILPGHEDVTVERVVTQTDRYAIVEKIGTAATVAEALDPRD